jgi:hypothetical protein
MLMRVPGSSDPAKVPDRFARRFLTGGIEFLEALSREVVVGVRGTRPLPLLLLHAWFPVEEGHVEDPTLAHSTFPLPCIGVDVRGGDDSNLRFLQSSPLVFIVRCIAPEHLDRIETLLGLCVETAFLRLIDKGFFFLDRRCNT